MSQRTHDISHYISNVGASHFMDNDSIRGVVDSANDFEHGAHNDASYVGGALGFFREDLNENSREASYIFNEGFGGGTLVSHDAGIAESAPHGTSSAPNARTDTHPEHTSFVPPRTQSMKRTQNPTTASPPIRSSMDFFSRTTSTQNTHKPPNTTTPPSDELHAHSFLPPKANDPQKHNTAPPPPAPTPLLDNVQHQFSSLHQIEQYRKHLNAQNQNLHSISKFYSEDKLLSENDSLKQNINLLNIRIKSLENIIHIQNTELLRKDTHTTPHHTELTNKWRQKVYSLLIHKYTAEADLAATNTRHENELRTANNSLDSLHYKHNILLQKHSDLHAKLDIAHTDNKLLRDELDRASHREKHLHTQLAHGTKAQNKVRQMLTQFSQKTLEHFENLVHTKCAEIDALNKRIHFSESRVSMLNAVTVRNSKHHQQQLAALNKQLQQQAALAEKQKQQLQEMNITHEVVRDMEKEIDRLKKERDFLIKKNEEDLHSERESALAKEMDLERRLESEMRLKDQYGGQLKRVSSELDTARDNFDALRTKYREVESHLKQYVEEAHQLRERCQEQFNHVQEKIKQGVELAVGKTEEELRLMKQELQRMREERDEHTSEIGKLKESIQRMEEEHREDCRRKQEYLDMKMAGKESEIQTLQRERDMLMESNQKLGGIMNFGVPPIVAQASSGRATSIPTGIGGGRSILEQMRFEHSTRTPHRDLSSGGRRLQSDSILTQLDNVETLVESLLKDEE